VRIIEAAESEKDWANSKHRNGLCPPPSLAAMLQPPKPATQVRKQAKFKPRHGSSDALFLPNPQKIQAKTSIGASI
jgi:hypothetical protein